MKCFLKPLRAFGLLILFVFLQACAQGPAYRFLASEDSLDKVGIEATLTNDFLQRHERVMPVQLDEYLKKLAARMKLLCPSCTIQNYMGPSFEEEVKVIFPDGFEMNLSRDHRVIEVTATPIKIEELEVHTAKVTDYLLKAAEGMDLRPAKHTGGGHLHFDFKGFFRNDPYLFRNFLVDSFNNAELFEGLFGGEPNNAPSLRQLPLESQENFIKLIDDFDNQPFSLYEFITRMESEVYKNTYSPNFSPPQKYQALSLIHALNQGGTVEFRNVRPYQDGQSIELITKALLGRRDFLIREQSAQRFLEINRELQMANLSKSQKFQKALRYLEEAKVAPKTYFSMFPVELFDEAINYFGSGPDSAVILKNYAKMSAFDDEERFRKILKSKAFHGLEIQEKRAIAEIIVHKVSGTPYEEVFFKELTKRTPLSESDLKTIQKLRGEFLQGFQSCQKLLEPLL